MNLFTVTNVYFLLGVVVYDPTDLDTQLQMGGQVERKDQRIAGNGPARKVMMRKQFSCPSSETKKFKCCLEQQITNESLTSGQM